MSCSQTHEKQNNNNKTGGQDCLGAGASGIGRTWAWKRRLQAFVEIREHEAILPYFPTS